MVQTLFLLGRNTKDDVDIEYYSLQYFLRLACQGQTIALDMLHTTKECTEVTSDVWEYLQDHRKDFYTRNLKAFIGYAYQQAAKYGLRGSRLGAASEVLDLLKAYPPEDKLHSVWESLPARAHCHVEPPSPNGIPQYSVCGKILQATMSIGYAVSILNEFYDKYGARARMAEKNEGIDGKAVSHAIRAAIQVKSILTDGDIVFPLKDAPYLLKVKQGKLDYSTQVAPVLEELMDEVKALSDKSPLPNEVDTHVWDEWLIRVYETRLFTGCCRR